jgi:hypothetical protein
MQIFHLFNSAPSDPLRLFFSLNSVIISDFPEIVAEFHKFLASVALAVAMVSNRKTFSRPI